MAFKKLVPYAGAVLAAGFLFALSEGVLSLFAKPSGASPVVNLALSLAHRGLFYTVAMALAGFLSWGVAAALAAVGKKRGPKPARAAAAAMFACILTSDVFWTVVAILNPKRIVLFGHKFHVWQPAGFAAIFLAPLVVGLGVATFALYKIFGKIKKGRRLMTIAGGAAVAGWLVIAVLLAAQHARKPAPAANYPDVFFITLDAWRADTCGPRENGPSLTPNIDRFAEDAYVFRRARSQSSWTLPSFSTIFTSQYPAVHGAAALRPLGTNQPTLAEVLAGRGYDTRAVVANELCLPAYGIPRGFGDYHYWNMAGWLKTLGFYETNFSYPVRKLREEKLNSRITTVLTEVTLGKLERRQGRPIFLWLHYLDPHGPYWPPPEYADAVARRPLEDKSLSRYDRGAILRARYEAEVRYVDDELGRILRILERRPNAVVIISSDHGEEFLEHGGFDHGHTVYEELLRVPLIMKFPERGHGEIETPVSTIDVGPTILDYLGIEAPASMQGRSFWPIIYDTEDERPSFAGPTQLKGSSKEAVYYKGKKFIYDYKYRKAGAWYDLESDPGEHRPRPPDDPEGAKLWKLLTTWREINREFKQYYWAEEDAAALSDAMRAMGYVK
jgi:arylsulfatase A-like enzyme